MDYDKKFSENDGDLMTVQDFLESCEIDVFIDDDGYGYPVKDGLSMTLPICPSKREMIPADATHILWFNR